MPEGSATSDVIDVGLGHTIEIDRDGVLYLRINESPVAWDDNQGGLAIKVNLLTD